MTKQDGNIDRESVVVASGEQVSANLTADFSGQAVVLGLKKGMYYELNETGARIWDHIQQPRSVQELLDTLLETYDVSVQECEADLLKLLEQMAANNLIEIRNG